MHLRLQTWFPFQIEICAPLDWEYYWTCCESEYATDVMFRDPDRLAALYPCVVQHALLSFGSADVLRFWGHKVPLSGKIHPKFEGQVVTDLKVRPEGIRIKHRAELRGDIEAAEGKNAVSARRLDWAICAGVT